MADSNGVIGALWRYPVKSMLGEELEVAVVGDRGVAGDRAHALIDEETGLVVSAKNPRRWEALFSCSAQYLEEPDLDGPLPPAEITLPNGDLVRTDQGDAAERVSRALGRSVRLSSEAPEQPTLEAYWPDVEGVASEQRETVTRAQIALLAPPGTFFDGAPIHVVTSATLDSLSDAYPGGAFDARRFRPNVVVNVSAQGFPENDWVGGRMSVGPDTEMEAVLAVPRCVMTTLAQADLARDKKILQTVAKENRVDIPGLGPSSCVGVYAIVTTSGTVRVGDSVETTPAAVES